MHQPTHLQGPVGDKLDAVGQGYGPAGGAFAACVNDWLHRAVDLGEGDLKHTKMNKRRKRSQEKIRLGLENGYRAKES